MGLPGKLTSHKLRRFGSVSRTSDHSLFSPLDFLQQVFSLFLYVNRQIIDQLDKANSDCMGVWMQSYFQTSSHPNELCSSTLYSLHCRYNICPLFWPWHTPCFLLISTASRQKEQHFQLYPSHNLAYKGANPWPFWDSSCLDMLTLPREK